MEDIKKLIYTEYPNATSVSDIVRNASNEIERLRAENAQLRMTLSDCVVHLKHFIKNHDYVVLAKAEAALDSIAPHPLYAAAPEMLIALEKCQPYMNDLEGENFDDASAGIFQDKELSLAVETLRFAIKKAKGEPY